MFESFFNVKRLKKFIYDSSIDVSDRSFIIFSILVLIALFLAVPAGIIMKEPVSATVSTLFGTLFFSIYVYISYRKQVIPTAKKILSIIVVCGFLPAMFFTNGGVYGGTPIWLLLGIIYVALILDGTWKIVMTIANGLVLAGCWVVAYYYPETVSEYSKGQNFFDTMAGLLIVGGIIFALLSIQITLIRIEDKDKNLKKLFEQTATALVNAIDAKDTYTHGHSSRVAEYSKRIAELSGKTPAECDEIYYVALLHDVGKIGIPVSIINKKGKLTDEEYETIKQHTVLGSQILSGITEYPNLMIGAKYHHERYDGKGYPDRLKGEDIPEIARIISVADAYDAMTSKRSYRDTIPQQSVREEIVKGSGTQFDPRFAKIMQHLIDMDAEYEMKEKDGSAELSGRSQLLCMESREEISEGILIGPGPDTRYISLRCNVIDGKDNDYSPAMIIFDSLDARYHDTAREIKELNYFEYCELRFDGSYELGGARKIEVKESKSTSEKKKPSKRGSFIYDIEAVKVKDHIQIKIDDTEKVTTFIIALPDSARYSYIGLTGDNCIIYDVNTSKDETLVPDDYISRIAEEISFIKGPSGDIPNIQVDGYRTASTEGIPVKDGMQIKFHTMSLPTARLVWHCPYVDLFYSEDKMPNGEGYMEYALIRLDGEHWDAESVASNKLIVSMGDDFVGWDNWKEENKKGYDCTVTFKVEDNVITTTTENLGVNLKVITTIIKEAPEVYVSLSGDQCALTNIRILNG